MQSQLGRVMVILLLMMLRASIGEGAPPKRHASRRLQSSNRFTYLNSFNDCLVSRAFPGHIATRWRAESSIGEVVLVDLSRVGRRTDLLQRTVSNYNLGADADSALRFTPRDPDNALVDVNGDGALDLISSLENGAVTFVWSPADKTWSNVNFPVASGARAVCWGVMDDGGPATILVRSLGITGAWQFVDNHWEPAHQLTVGLEINGRRLLTGSASRDRGVRLLDLDGDGRCELVAAGSEPRGVLSWSEAGKRWIAAPFRLPDGVSLTDSNGRDGGLRFVDVDNDGDQDIVHSNETLANMSATLYCHPLPKNHREHIERYTNELIDKLEQVAMAAFQNQQPARLFWSTGKVGFARNRRTKGGPVDHDLPVLVVKDLDGDVRAVYVSYACHCTTLSHNKVSGDWAGYAQELIQRSYPGAIALVSAGCGADANPRRGPNQDETAAQHGQEISDEVNRLLHPQMNGQIRPISGELDARFARVNLQLAKIPSRAEWEARAKKDSDRGGTIGYHARVHLQRLDRNEPIKTKVPLPVQTWTFDDDLAIVFLGGEAVVDYSVRLKKELDHRRVWINAYANEVPCYIPSERVLREGGYEGGGAMTFHDWASPFLPGLEKKIVDEVHYQLGKKYRQPHPHLWESSP